MLALIMYSFLCMGLALFIHEFGHYIALVYYGHVPKVTLQSVRFIRVGNPEIYRKLNHREAYFVYLCGVGSGALVIAAFSSFINVFFFVLLLPYLMGSHNDLRMMYKILRRKE